VLMSIMGGIVIAVALYTAPFIPLGNWSFLAIPFMVIVFFGSLLIEWIIEGEL